MPVFAVQGVEIFIDETFEIGMFDLDSGFNAVLCANVSSSFIGLHFSS